MTDPQPAPGLPGITELEALEPIECVRQLTVLGRPRGNLPPAYAELRIRRLVEIQTRYGSETKWLAEKTGLVASSIRRLLNPNHAVRARLAEGAASS